METVYRDSESSPQERSREDSENLYNLLDSDTQDEPMLAPKPEPVNVLKLSNEGLHVSTPGETERRPPKIQKRAEDGDVTQSLATSCEVSATDGPVIKFMCGCCERGHHNTTSMSSGRFGRQGQKRKGRAKRQERMTASTSCVR